MQARMKKYPLTPQQISDLLKTETVGRLATNGDDGYPYITPVHFVYMQEKIFIHGLAAGKKIANIKNNAFVGFEIEKMFGLLHHENDPCDTNTEYQSVVIRGQASIVENNELRLSVLDAFVAKYAPQHQGKPYPQSMVKMTTIIAIDIQSCTGKFYPAQA